MKNLTVVLNGTSAMSIVEVNICNDEEVLNIDADILHQSISDNRLESESEIKSFCDGCDEVSAYYSSQSAKEEFESYMMLSKAEKISDYEINLHDELS